MCVREREGKRVCERESRAEDGAGGGGDAPVGAEGADDLGAEVHVDQRRDRGTCSGQPFISNNFGHIICYAERSYM